MDTKEFYDKFLKGCGCLTIGGIAMMILLGIIGTCLGDDKDGETKEQLKAALAEAQKKDSVIVNEPLEGRSISLRDLF